jgi:hypothetical protein
MSVYGRLDDEWERLGASGVAARRLAVWAAAEPALAGYRNPRDVVADIAARGHAERSHQLLGCLLRQADDPVAARVFLQAILPALRSAKVWRPVEDHSAERVAATWEAIRLHAGESPRYPARFIVRIAERKLRTGHQAAGRHASRLTVLDPDYHSPSVQLDDTRPAAEQIAARVIDAYRTGTLSQAQARLLYATAVIGLRASDAGRLEGLAHRSVYRALGAAQTALINRSA